MHIFAGSGSSQEPGHGSEEQKVQRGMGGCSGAVGTPEGGKPISALEPAYNGAGISSEEGVGRCQKEFSAFTLSLDGPCVGHLGLSFQPQ